MWLTSEKSARTSKILKPKKFDLLAKTSKKSRRRQKKFGPTQKYYVPFQRISPETEKFLLSPGKPFQGPQNIAFEKKNRMPPKNYPSSGLEIHKNLS